MSTQSSDGTVSSLIGTQVQIRDNVNEDIDDEESGYSCCPVGPVEMKALAHGLQIEKDDKRKRELESNDSLVLREKRVKVESSYSYPGEKLPEITDFVVKPLGEIVRKKMFPDFKFVLGEGSYVIKNNPMLARKLRKFFSEYGNSHEKMDLVDESDMSNYARLVLNEMKMTSENYTWAELGMWWHLYSPVIKEQMSSYRSRKGHEIRKAVQAILTQTEGTSSAAVANTGYYKLIKNYPKQNLDGKSLRERKKEIYDKVTNDLKGDVDSLVDWCGAQEDGMMNIRDDEKKFGVFLDVVMQHLKTNDKWKNEIYVKKVSELFTSSDEAMAMLYFENYHNDFKIMKSTRKEVPRNESNPTWTKSDKNGNGYKGWHIDGVNRYNELFDHVERKRKEDGSVRLEASILDAYKKFVIGDGLLDSDSNGGDTGNTYSNDEGTGGDIDMSMFKVRARSSMNALVAV